MALDENYLFICLFVYLFLLFLIIIIIIIVIVIIIIINSDTGTHRLPLQQRAGVALRRLRDPHQIHQQHPALPMAWRGRSHADPVPVSLPARVASPGPVVALARVQVVCCAGERVAAAAAG